MEQSHSLHPPYCRKIFLVRPPSSLASRVMRIAYGHCFAQKFHSMLAYASVYLVSLLTSVVRVHNLTI